MTVRIVVEKVSFCGGASSMQGVFLPPLRAVPNWKTSLARFTTVKKVSSAEAALVGLLPQKSSFRAVFLQCSFSSSRLAGSVCLTFYPLRSFGAEASFSDSAT